MPVEKSYARLGFFVVVSLVVIVGTLVFFVQRMKSREVIPAVTYTEGNVTGLDIGSPVRFRGIEVGRVADLRVLAGSALVEIDFDLFVDRLTDLGTDVRNIKAYAATGSLHPLRAQVVSQPISGAAYLLVDRPAAPPPVMTLPFTPTRAYVSSMPTALTKLEDQLPALMDRAVAVLQTLETVIHRLPDSLDHSDRFLASVEKTIRDSNLPAMSTDSRKFFAATTEQMEHMTADLDRTLGPKGTLEKFVQNMDTLIAAANLQETTASTRDAMNQTSLAADDLRRSLPAIRDTLAQLRDLARLLEAQPESVVYGARPAKGKK